MRRWFPLLWIAGIVFLAARPLWWQPAPFFFMDDGFLHLFRIFELDRVLHEGVIYPRWAPDLTYGYGYPVFNYYPPLSYYIAETLHLLGLEIPAAVQAVFVVVFVVGASGAFVLAKELFDTYENASVIAALCAVAYVFFPYFLLDLYTRGAIAEALAAAVLPWLLWSLHRALARPAWGSVALSAVLAAMLVLAHNLTAFLSAPLVALFVIWEWIRLPVAKRACGLLGLVSAGLVAIALSAIYWLPLIAELSLVVISHASKQLAIIVQYSFLHVQNVIQPSLLYQYHEAPFPLALVPMALAALAVVTALVARPRQQTRGTIIFFGAVALLGAVLMTDWTQPLWLRVPLLANLQFPWRVSVLIGLGAAMAVGALPLACASISKRLVVPGMLVLSALWVTAGMTNLEPVRLDNPRDPITVAQLARFEVNSKSAGLSTMDEYLPLSVKYLPRALESRIGEEPSAQINLVGYSSARRVVTVETAEPVALSLHSFYFPDWQVTIDDQPVVAGPSTAMGLLTVQVPTGKHTVVFSLGDTLPRRAGVALTMAGVLVMLALIAQSWRRRESNWWQAPTVAGMLLAVFAVPNSLAVFAHPLPLQPTQVDVSPELNMIGLRVASAELNANGWHAAEAPDALDLQVFWQVKQQMKDVPIAWRLVDEAGGIRAGRTQLARYATGFAATWVPGEIVEDHYDLSTAGLARGRYTLQVAYGENADFRSASVIEFERGTPAAPNVQISKPMEAQVGDRIHLLGYAAPTTARAGQTLPLTLYWRADRDVNEDLTVFAQLLDRNGNLVAQHDGLTDDGFLPTTLWLPGVTVPDRRDLALPANLKPGVYRLVAGLYRYEGMARLPVVTAAGASPDDQVELGTIKVPMEAQGARPEHALVASLGSSIRLRGYNLQVAGSEGVITLYWEAMGKIDRDYKVFVHIVDAEGKVVAQKDQMPGEDGYPTGIWAVDETVVDSYHIPLALAPGEYRVRVGIYDPGSGERLVARDANGVELENRAVELDPFEVPRR